MADSAERNGLQLVIAEYWANWLGIELNEDKREVPRSATRHLGFQIDLKHKMVSLTIKHRRKVVSFFDRLGCSIRTNGRIPVSSFQKMVGLQIWVSTVFRVTRQFITSTCDVLRKCNSLGWRFFFPRKEKKLVSRVLHDLKFWRRFVSHSPQSSMDFLLGNLPFNDKNLFSDASTSYGMAGVIMFRGINQEMGGVEGLF